MKNSSPHYARLRQARDRIWSSYRHDPNFTGCGIGFRQRAGQRTDELVVIAMVVHKMPAGSVSARRMLPANVRIDGRPYGVDVVQVGLVFAAGRQAAAQPADVANTGPITAKMRPLVQGCSISNLNAEQSNDGTLGCFVTDNTDGSVCLLSANHVIARLNQAAIDELIVQPAMVDGGDSLGYASAYLKRFIPLVAGDTDLNVVDAAIAQLMEDYTPDVADGLMAPISASHPAVGMVVGSDDGGNCFLCRMDTALNLLNVSLLPATSGSPCVVSPEPGMYIEKVGRTSGYTASIVDAIDVTVTVHFVNGTMVMTDMIWTQFFSIAGDSGAVACQGGNGRTFVLPPGAPCPLLSAVESYYALPTANNNALTNKMQSQFLAQSLTGSLMIQLVYLNSQVAIDRLATDQGSAYNQASAQEFAQDYYTKYTALLTSVLANPDGGTVVTQQNISDGVYIIDEIANPASEGYEGLLTQPEIEAAVAIYAGIVANTVSMNFQQVVDYMNESSIFNEIYSALATVSTIEMP
jgi:hypothetical protein